MGDHYQTCDRCGRGITPDIDHCHELLIGLNGDENCTASYWRHRNYCRTCLEPAWKAINIIIGGDPDAEKDPAVLDVPALLRQKRDELR